MTFAKKLDPISVEDYLAGELDAPIKREYVSRKTRQLDEGEKKDAYLTIPSLTVYVLIEQDTAAVTVYRRAEEGFVREVYVGLDAVLPLGEIETELPLVEIYEGVEFTPEADEDSEQSESWEEVS